MKFVAVVVFMVCVATGSYGQVADLGKKPVSMGTKFLVHFATVQSQSTEKPRPEPLFVQLLSLEDGEVTVTSTPNGQTPIEETITLKGGEAYQYLAPLWMIPDTSRILNDLTISVESDVEISVRTYYNWAGNGELVDHIPVAYLGTDYLTTNTFADRFGGQAPYTYRGSQVAIAATRDETVVDITSALPIITGQDLEDIGGGNYRVQLDSGESVLVLWDPEREDYRKWSSDPSGSHITSNHPISVISGATKTAMMQMPDVLPPTGPFAAGAHFVRNMMIENIQPLGMGATEFVTLPCLYTAVRVRNGAIEEFGMGDDRGEIVRFIANEDDTRIERMDSVTKQWVNEAQLDSGETFVVEVVEKPTAWRSTKPIHVYQYGKSFARVVAGVVNKDEANSQGHPTVEAGMPMMMAVPGVDQWVDQGVFYCRQGMDNYVGIVLTTEDVEEVFLDDDQLSALDIIEIEGTDYSYVSLEMSPGTHTITTTTDSARFMAWTYGSLDGLAQGRAYGAIVGINYAKPGEDSAHITLDNQKGCNEMTGSIDVVQEGNFQGSISSIALTSSTNCIMASEIFTSTTAIWNLEIEDIGKDASSEVTITMSNGRRYVASQSRAGYTVSSDPPDIPFGAQNMDSTLCRSVELTNTTDGNLWVANVSATNGDVFSADPTEFQLGPGEKQNIEICVSPNSEMILEDSVVITLECGKIHHIPVDVRGDSPGITVRDVRWTTASGVDGPISKPLEITNTSDVNLWVSGITLDDETFFGIGDVVYPLLIPAQEKRSVDVVFTPDGNPHVGLEAFATVHSNASELDSVARIRIESVTSVDELDVASNAISVSPHPIIIGSGTPARIELPREGLTIQLYDIEGRLVWSTSEAPLIMTIPENVVTHSGAFVLIAKDKRGSVQQTITVVE